MLLEKIIPAYVTIPGRGRLRIDGPDAEKFLQGLISNDVQKLDSSPSLYACLLSPQGKFLHDFIISRDGPAYILDCEGGERTRDLLRRLTMYKLRSQIMIEAQEDVATYSVLGQEMQGVPDPRNLLLGIRTTQKPDLPEKDFAAWDCARIHLALPDGSRDAETGKSTLEELNIARLAVSFDKGCYVGQELTARMEHRGLAKRHLVALGFNMPVPAYGEDIVFNKKSIGSMRSCCGLTGLALLYDEDLEPLRDLDDKSPLYLLGQ